MTTQMDSLHLSFHQGSYEDDRTNTYSIQTATDPFSNVVAFDTEFNLPSVHHPIQTHSASELVSLPDSQTDRENELKILVKEINSEKSVSLYSKEIDVKIESELDTMSQDSEVMSTSEYLTRDRPTPTGASSEDSFSAFTKTTEGLALNTTHLGTSVVAQHAAAYIDQQGPESSKTTNITPYRHRIHTTKHAPTITGDLNKNPDLIRITHTDITREIKGVKMQETVGNVEEMAAQDVDYDLSNVDIGIEAKEDTHNTIVTVPYHNDTEALGVSVPNNIDDLSSADAQIDAKSFDTILNPRIGQSNDNEMLSPVSTTDSQLDSGIYLTSQLQQSSPESFPARPMFMSTPLSESSFVSREIPSRFELSELDGRSRSSSEDSQQVQQQGQRSYNIQQFGHKIYQDHSENANLYATEQVAEPSMQTRTTSETEVRDMSKDITQIMQERAHLEGQLEIITEEANAALEEKARLYAQVISLQSSLAAKSKSESVENNLSVSFQQQEEFVILQRQLSQLQDELEEKIANSKNAQEELDLTLKSNKDLTQRIKALQNEVHDREHSVKNVKNKLSDVQTQLQSSFQIKTQLENEIHSMRNDHAALINAKDWYQEQLQFAQTARIQLQNELAQLQNKTIQQANVIEGLRQSNTQLQHNLSYSHQMSLQEKEKLARHLETIELDMVEREAGFERIRHEQTQSEDALDKKIEEVEMERKRLSSLISDMADLEKELEQKRTDLKQNQAKVTQLECMYEELNQKLSQTQNNTSDKDNVIQMLQQKYEEASTRMTELMRQMGNKETENRRLVQEKSHIENALKDALSQKENFDKAVITLKEDMMKVEYNFRQMKQQLNEKCQELEKVHSEKSSFTNQVLELQKQISSQKMSFEGHSDNIKQQNALIQDLTTQKANLETEVKSLKQALEQIQLGYNSVNQENLSLQQELNNVKLKCENVEDQLQGVLEQNAHLEGRLEFVHVEQNKQAHITQENSLLKSKVTDLEAKLNDDVIRYESKISQITSEIKELWEDRKQKEKKHESSVNVLTKKLRGTLEAKEAAENVVKNMKSSSLMNEHAEEWKAKAQNLESAVQSVHSQKNALEYELNQYKFSVTQDITKYQQKITELEQQLKDVNQRDFKRQLDLEKEKGRVSGIQQSHMALKQHASILEEALSRREVLLNEVRSQHEIVMQNGEKKQIGMSKKVQQLEDSIKKERSVVKELKKKLLKEGKDKNKLQTSIDSLQSKLEAGNQDVIDGSHYEQTVSELQNYRQLHQQLMLKVEMQRTENKKLMLEIDELKKSLLESEAKHPLYLDQVQSLKWLIEQKTKEVESFANQLRLSEERHEVEIHNFNKALKASRSECDTVKAELSSTRKAKYAYQSKLSELKDSLKLRVKQHKKKLNVSSEGIQADVPVMLDVDEVEKILQKDFSPLSYTSRPIERLHSCLEFLRSEMTGLQQSISQHSLDVQNSSASWREVETLVQSVKKACDKTTDQHGAAPDVTLPARNANNTPTKSGGMIDI